jgi:shikimate dehydrogenase
MADRAFVIGDPIAHSRSPLIHGHWLRHHNIAGSYEAIHVKQHELPGFLDNLVRQGFVGGNVTVPHKEMVFELVKKCDEIARQIGAVNTIWVEEGELRASNTDSFGFSQNLDEQAPGWDDGTVAVVIGAGGASRGVIHALKSRGFSDIRVANRSVERAQELVSRFGSAVSAHRLSALDEITSGARLIINTSSLGMKGVGHIAIDMNRLADDALVTDIVYIPLETPFLAAARLAGRRTVDGLGMLLHQARPGFEKWFGVMPKVTQELRQLIIDDMERVDVAGRAR